MESAKNLNGRCYYGVKKELYFNSKQINQWSKKIQSYQQETHENRGKVDENFLNQPHANRPINTTWHIIYCLQEAFFTFSLGKKH